MPEIIEIRSIAGTQPRTPSASDLKTELKQRAALVQPTAFVDTANFSEGEMRLFLLAQRDKILSEFYQGTQAGAQYRKDFEQKRDVLYKGLHTLGLDYAGLRLASQPASGWLGWADKQRQPTKGIQLLFEDAPVSGIGAIPQLDCNALYPIMTLQQLVDMGASASIYPSYVADQNAKRLACNTENKWRASLNQYWEKGSLTLVYRAIPNTGYFTGIDPNAAAYVGQKKGNHIQTFNKIQAASKISVTNLSLWWENGNLTNSIAYGLGPQTGKQFVDGLKANADVQINGFGPALIGLAIDVLKNTYNQFKLLVNVLKGDLTLKQALEQHIDNVEQFFKTHTDDIANLASNKDWANPENGGPGSGDMPPLPQTGGSGFLANLSQTEKIGLGVALVGGAWLVTKN